MDTISVSAFEKAYNPFLLAGVIVATGIVLMLGGQIILSSGFPVSERFPWMVAGGLLLLYAIFNSIFSLSAKNASAYWGRSIFAYISLAIAGSLLAWAFSGITIYEAGSFRWIYVVLTFGYLIFLSLINIMKKIVEFAMKEEWQHPRIRNRNRNRNN